MSDLDFSALSGIGWPAAIAIVGILGLALFRRAVKNAEREDERNRERRAAYEREERALRDALMRGDAQAAAVARERVDRLRAKGWHKLGCAVFLFVLPLMPLSTGCAAAKAPKTVTIPLGTYATVVEPGATVPPLPEGETRWWLMSAPTGVGMMLPADSPLNLEEMK